MLEELIAKVTSVSFEESESWLYLDSVIWDGPTRLSLMVRLCCGDEPPESWNVSCNWVVAHDFRWRKCGTLDLTFDHPVLWPHNAPKKELYFSSTPSNPPAVFGSLVEAFLELVGPWFPISYFFNNCVPTIQLLSGRHGLLASGPEPIIDRLAAVLDGYGVRHKTLPIAYGKVVYNSDLQVRALVFDGAYVAAHSIEARRAEG